MSKVPFLIYDAAAGSGKTFTLVKEYIKLLILSEDPSYYNQILAITFTNKAVAEMKSRILENLVSFSKENIIESPSDMMMQLTEETQLTATTIHLRSKKIVKHLLHHYAGFSVETIDRFNHTLIRTFARDLSLSTNFEVSLESKELLIEAVDQLINKAGGEKTITELLLNFAIEKVDDDASWDISKDIVKTSKLIFNENDAPHLAKLQGKSIADFMAFKKELQSKKKVLGDSLKVDANATLQRIDEAGLQHDDFNRSSFPKHFLKLSTGDFNVSFDLGWQVDLETKPMYPKRVTSYVAEIMDQLVPDFVKAFSASKEHVIQIQLINAQLKNITPLSVINLVNQELQNIKEEQNILPIAEFNALINKEIKNQPAPFIYERLGERYKHFFIDEFQDTSLLQWENLIPLIDNALSQESENKIPGSLLLVGDAKQSIYRWRGGLPEQFINLTQKKHPFSIAQVAVENLPTNYRSCADVIDFNNRFFTSISSYFGDQNHKNLYTIGNQQNHTAKSGGYVHIEFNLAKEEKEPWYNQKLLETIEKLISNGFQKKDICVLTRNKKDGISLSSFLMEQGVAVVSSETLLLQNSPVVQCIINTLALSLYPDNQALKVTILDVLHEHLHIAEEKHDFFEKFLQKGVDFSEALDEYSIQLSLANLNTVSLYEGCEYILRQFHFTEKADAYIFGLMDFVFDFDQQPHADKLRFLEHWETKKDSASVATSQNKDAVQFMTIHKAKGLEFPVVIFPYADVGIYKEIEAKAWFPVENSATDFTETLINYNKEVANLGDYGEALTEKRRNTLELDAFNLLYVTLTRAVEQLYVFSEKPAEIKKDSPLRFSQLFSSFLNELNQWNDGQALYTFGLFQKKLAHLRPNLKEGLANKTVIQPNYISSTPSDNNIQLITKDAFLWETEAALAISVGNTLHETMAKINTAEDVPYIIEELISRAIIPSEEISLLRTKIEQIVSHPELERLFNGTGLVKNEAPIITKSGKLLIPDRINFVANKVTVLDYKTGAEYVKHGGQINEYAAALSEMGYAIEEKIIVYTSEDEILINKV